jgi:hypothetical protein
MNKQQEEQLIAANVPHLADNSQGCYISSSETYKDWDYIEFHVHCEGEFVGSFSLTKGEAFERDMEGYKSVWDAITEGEVQ